MNYTSIHRMETKEISGMIVVQPPTSQALVSPTNTGGLGANGWYKTVVRRISGA
jgi:hypothetical protein